MEDLLLAAVGELSLLQDQSQLGQVPLLHVLQGPTPTQGAAEPAEIADTQIIQKLLKNLHVEDLTHLPECEEGALVSLKHVGPQEGLSRLPGNSNIQRVSSNEHLHGQLVCNFKLTSLGKIRQVLNKI